MKGGNFTSFKVREHHSKSRKATEELMSDVEKQIVDILYADE